MKYFTTAVSDFRFNIHWYYIGRYRAQAAKLIDSGAQCSDPRLVTLSNKILEHGMVVSRLCEERRQQYPRSPDSDNTAPDEVLIS